jgi:hypothetical protein
MTRISADKLNRDKMSWPIRAYPRHPRFSFFSVVFQIDHLRGAGRIVRVAVRSNNRSRKCELANAAPSNTETSRKGAKGGY